MTGIRTKTSNVHLVDKKILCGREFPNVPFEQFGIDDARFSSNVASTFYYGRKVCPKCYEIYKKTEKPKHNIATMPIIWD